MRDEIPEDHPGILDDDPALDIIFLDEMDKEVHKKPKQNGGCAGVLLVFLLPACLLVYLSCYFLR